MNKTLYLFPNSLSASLSEVGGKGLSLMVGSDKGLPVPPGFILSVTFFAPWFATIKESKVWTAFLKSNTDDIEKICKELKHEVLQLSFSNDQQKALSEALEKYDEKILFAVRSSSPEEDLEGSSFAGGYETVLGVTKANLKHAIKKAFASCLDYRVVVYKRENGFDIKNPKIAVVVQEQIASEIAGVGFSLNPVTNNYDDAVFNANWGLGETVVAGLATPDTYTVDKVAMQIKEKIIGAKELSIWLTPTGGTVKKTDPRHKEYTLTDEQIIALTRLIKKVEEEYKKPMDIEWAFSQNQLYLLQARPITSYFPLSPELETKPGEKKRLYIDVTSTVQGMDKPVSKMGTSMFKQLLRTVGRIVFARDITADITKAIGWMSDGKIFVNLSYAMNLVGRKKVTSTVAAMDPLAAKIFEHLDEKEYASSFPKFLLLPYGMMWRLPGILLFIRKAKQRPDHIHTFIQHELQIFEKEAREIANQDITLHELIDELLPRMFLRVFRRTVPLFVTSRQTLGEMKKLAQANDSEINKLQLSLPYNMTTEMGLALFRVSQYMPANLDEKKLKEGLKTKSLPPEFIKEWETFLEKYGMRGSSEIDLAAPRYNDDPKLLLDLLLSMRNAKGENPQERFDQNQSERRKTFDALYQKTLARNPKDAALFKKEYHFFETFGGYRETHKYYLIFINYLLRQRILKEAQALVDAKRLDSIGQVFDLTIDQLDSAKTDISLNLRELAKTNTVFLHRLEHATRIPSLIDSRGFIPSPPPSPIKKGETAGMPVSPGIVRGRIKVLHSPTEKPLEKGEILVARATDPGWTPLFVNAGGLIMEVGGILQHGALVAREYGLPCVSGVINATTLWKDGTMVEVDGTAGIIRIVNQK